MTGASLVLAAPAKVNLLLRVVARRPDGYHELETVLQALSLSDAVGLQRRPGSGIELSADVPWVPLGPENLAWKGAASFFEATGARGGVAIRLSKRIPAGGGLGGGSSDLAAVLAGMDQLWGTGLGLEGLGELAGALSSDAPFFLHGGRALCRGRGERVEPLDGAAALHLVLILPCFPCPTPEVYAKFRPQESSRLEKFQSSLDKMGSPDQDPREWMFNDLEPAARRAVPALDALMGRLESRGLEDLRVSGSGSTLFRAFRLAGEADRFAAKARKVVERSEALVIVAKAVGPAAGSRKQAGGAGRADI